jgi:hypothetical protein
LAAPHKAVEASVVVVGSFLKNQRASQGERREISEGAGDRERSDGEACEARVRAISDGEAVLKKSVVHMELWIQEVNPAKKNPERSYLLVFTPKVGMESLIV